jgi:hypothetical protein
MKLLDLHYIALVAKTAEPNDLDKENLFGKKTIFIVNLEFSHSTK